jgi:hypothetical protein
MEVLSGFGDLVHEFWCGLEVPVGIGDMGMTEVGAQRDHMALDGIWISAALLEGANGKGVPQIVEAWAWMTGACTQSDGTDHAQEYGNYRGIAENGSLLGDEHVGGSSGKMGATAEVPIQLNVRRFVKWYQAGFAELGLSDN